MSKHVLNEIRIQVEFIEANTKGWIVPDFHFVPRIGDWFDPDPFIGIDGEKEFTDDELSKIYNLFWSVAAVEWTKDDIGVLVKVLLEGE